MGVVGVLVISWGAWGFVGVVGYNQVVKKQAPTGSVPTAGSSLEPAARRSPLRTAPLSLLVLLLIIFALIMVSSDGPATAGFRLAFVIRSVFTAGLIAASYFLSAAGLGRLMHPLFRDSPCARTLQVICGLSLLLFLDHLLAATGLLSNTRTARILILPGLFLWLAQVRRVNLSFDDIFNWHPFILILLPSLAVLLLASSSLPGWLWGSEAHGYDVLEYHLQLPVEWLRTGRLTGLKHNVYSFLPDYVEAGYLHLVSLVGSPHRGNGLALRSSQFLHALVALYSAYALGQASLQLARRGNINIRPTGFPPALFAAALFLALPWVVVTASLAYDEMFVILFFTGIFMILTGDEISPTNRLLLTGWLSGLALAAKLTSAFVVIPPVVILIFYTIPPRRLFGLLYFALPAGFLALLPYFLRNFLQTGNPVFPFAADLFGPGHWTRQQVQRWSAAHHFQGDMTDRFAALWSRGVAHPQWSLFFLLLLIFIIVGLANRNTRRFALLITLCLAAQFLAWAAFTHIQARFLLPVLVPGVLLITVVTADIKNRLTPAPFRAVAVLLTLFILIGSGTTILIFLRQRDGQPCFQLEDWADDVLTGKFYHDHPELLKENIPTPGYYINYQPDSVKYVYLLGDATPLYYKRDVLYHTTWDTSPLGELARQSADSGTWARGLQQRGITHLLVDYGEIERLHSDGWYDPAVTPALVRRLAQEQGEPVADWGFMQLLRLRRDN